MMNMLKERTNLPAIPVASDATVYLYLLGSLRIEREQEPIDLLRRKVDLLLVYLVLHPQPHSRDTLTSLFWSQSSHEKARHSLRTALATLRQSIGDRLLLTERDSVQLNPDFPLWVDLRELQAATTLVDELELSNSNSLYNLLALWRGKLLPEFDEEWIVIKRNQLHDHLCQLFLGLLQQLRTRSDYLQAVDVAQTLLSHDPANEQAHQHLIFCLVTLGEHAAALRQYQECEQELQRIAERPPTPETRALYRWLKGHDNAEDLLTAKLTNLPIPLSSFVGRQQQVRELKWMLAPSLLGSSAQQSRLLTLLGAGGSGKTRLAIQVATTLVDRFEDGVWWVDMTTVNDEKLVAHAVAKALGVQVVDEQKLTQSLTQFLGEKQLLLVIDNCEHLIDPCAMLLSELLSNAPNLQILATSREALRIDGEMLWNVPTLALPEAALLESITHVEIDQLMQIDCMRLFVERAAAVQHGFHLTPENAQSVATICQRLDGIPLAIELAAARVRVLSVDQIVHYLTGALGARFDLLTQNKRTLLPRQQTLSATIDWSYNLLNEAERYLFRYAALFQGGFTLEALKEIADCGVRSADSGVRNESTIHNPQSAIRNPLDLLTQLIDKSMVIAEPQGGQPRYRMLETLREYALSRVTSQDELSQMRACHADYYHRLATSAVGGLRGMEQRVWLDHLSLEYGNLHAALVWFEEVNQTEAGLHMSSNLVQFWYDRSHFEEGQRWLRRFLKKWDREAEATSYLIDANNGLALLLYGQSNYSEAHKLYQHNLTLAQENSYDDGFADASLGLGQVVWEQGNYATAASLLDNVIEQSRATGQWVRLARALSVRTLVYWTLTDLEAAHQCSQEMLEIAQQLNHPSLIANALFKLALLHDKQGLYTEARTLYEEAIARYRQLGNQSMIADAYINLGMTAFDLGDFTTATTHLQEAAQINKKLGDHADVAYSLCTLADIAFYQEQYEDAYRLYHEALPLFRSAGNKRLLASVLGGLGWIACRQGDFSTAASLCAESLTLRHSINHHNGVLSSLEEGYAELAAALGQPMVAARLLAHCERMRAELSLRRAPVKTKVVESLRHQIQTQLGERAFAIASTEGKSLSIDQAVTLALGICPSEATAQPTTSLRIYALGPGTISCGERLLTSADWTYDKARELVFYLLMYPNATRNEIGLHLWPDATDEQVRKRFSVAVTHARTALGRHKEWIIQEEGRYRLNPAHAWWLDVEHFQANIKAAKLALKENPTSQQAMKLLEAAIALYQGDFIEDFVDGEWHQSQRTTLLDTYVEALVTLAALHLRVGHADAALPLYQQALAKDTYCEDAYVGTIRAYLHLNQRGQALRQTDALVAALAELQVTPSFQTQSLLLGLRGGDALY